MSALTPCAYTRNRRISLFFWIPSGSTLFAHVDDGHLAINGSASSSALDKTMRLLRSVVFFATLLILTRDLPPQSLLASLSNLHYSPETRCSHVHSMTRRSIHKLPQPEHPQDHIGRSLLGCRSGSLNQHADSKNEDPQKELAERV